ncbi:MAG: hypothetical protein RMX68_007690 [Aulosira sp. ZfuVER01]|nr:hypothetical protein [Aulosira sp. ZfuVER01]MDZ7998904.1 hypothetical protein [Aulosira sp. DedVER01a]MDZ8053644.1 hypothetical protein [Aulosira sp. ZfuCHP01]
MKTETVNLPRSITNHLRITSIAILFISVYLIIPKTASTTAAFSSVPMESLGTSSESLTTSRSNSQELKQTFTPRNYGGPDSQHGSGTR